MSILSDLFIGMPSRHQADGVGELVFAPTVAIQVLFSLLDLSKSLHELFGGESLMEVKRKETDIHCF